jgi:N-acetylglucosaminyl-diphospho-decaprenol L-rhamnosyltransferase
MTGTSFAAIVVTYESAAHVEPGLRAVSAQLTEDDELIVVDNASKDETRATVRQVAPRARLVTQDSNLGFASACNAGAVASSAPLLLFLNPDTVAAPGFLDALRAIADERLEWGAWQGLVTLPGGREINTSGGVAHFLGMGWAGRCGKPVSAAPPAPTEVSFASGAALVVRRPAWERVGGFDARYFMYGEDLDLSLRIWLSGLRVGVVPTARAEHDYEFAKGDRKWFLLERNRWWTILSDYPTALLALLAPALLLSELALLLVALRGGWLRAKLRSQAAVLRDLSQILARRRQVQRLRAVGAATFAERLTASLDSPYLGHPARSPTLQTLQRTYWALVLWALSAGTRLRRSSDPNSVGLACLRYAPPRNPS